MIEQLDETWSSLSGASGLTGRRPAGLPVSRVVYLALDHAGVRHLCIRLEDSGKPVQYPTMRGLDVTTCDLAVGGTPLQRYIDLACSDRVYNPSFLALSDDLIRLLQSTSTPESEIVRATLNRWRSFWSLQSAGLTQEEALGLFGELWFLHHWIRAESAGDLAMWTAPTGTRHDFQSPLVSVEAKTYAGTGSPVHRISSLDQLADPSTGELFLFSLHVVDDGLAGNTLPALVSALHCQLSADAQVVFAEYLAQYGYSPAQDAQYGRRLRIIAEQLYLVSSDFPRLVLASFTQGLPGGIDDVTYSILSAACQRWLIATTPHEASTRLSQMRESSAPTPGL